MIDSQTKTIDYEKLERLQKMLSNTTMFKPESRLLLAIILQAVADLSNKKYCKDALEYFESDYFNFHCQLLKISAKRFRKEYLECESYHG